MKASTLAFSGSRNSMDPRPKTWCWLRRAMMRRIHHSSELGFCCWASTLTVSKWYSGSMITGRKSRWGFTVENPALRSGLHCIGVRTAVAVAQVDVVAHTRSRRRSR